jgi:hypothetical protein
LFIGCVKRNAKFHGQYRIETVSVADPIFSTGSSKLLKISDIGEFLLPSSDTSLPVDESGTKKSPRPARRKNQNSSEEKKKTLGIPTVSSREELLVGLILTSWRFLSCHILSLVS